MELRNSYMYGVDVVFHQQLLQVPFDRILQPFSGQVTADAAVTLG
jgi:hypothetical protein